MHSAEINYHLYIQTQELDNDSFPPACGILIDLVETDWPSNFDFDKAPDPVLFDHTPQVLRRFCLRLNSLHYLLRVTLPSGPEPVVLTTAGEINAFLARFAGRARDKSMYRTEMWCVPGGSSPALDAIQSFEMLGKDVGMFDQALGHGAMRLTLEMSSLTLTLACSDLADATDWVKYALEGATVPVRWALPL